MLDLSEYPCFPSVVPLDLTTHEFAETTVTIGRQYDPDGNGDIKYIGFSHIADFANPEGLGLVSYFWSPRTRWYPFNLFWLEVSKAGIWISDKREREN